MQQPSGKAEGGEALSQPHACPSTAKELSSAGLGWGVLWMPQQMEIQAWNGFTPALCSSILSFDAIMSLTNLQICIEPFI